MNDTLQSPDIDEATFQTLVAQQREITDEEISSMLERVRPVVRKNDTLFYIELVDPRSMSFLWDPQFVSEAVGLREHSVIHTLHEYGYYGLFKPSIEEVLSILPEDAIESGVVAFETLGPRDTSDLNRQWAAVNGGYHVANTILYTAA